ncbi:MAG: AsmA-like C-terminal region-containing protein, partial [Beijerinckiaceae bacterium]
FRSNLTLDELSLASGMRNLPVDFDMPLNGKLSVSLGPEGRAARAHGTFDAAGGYFLVRDRDFEPVLVESVKGDVRWSADSGTFALEDIRIKAGKTALTLGGQVVPPKDGTGDWRLLLETKGALQFAHQIAADKAVVMRQMAVALRLRPETKHLAIERFSLTGPDIDMLVQGSFDYEPGKRRLQIAGQVDAAPLDKVRSLWPPFLAAPVRAWVLRNLSGGSLDLLRARLDFDEATLAALAAKRAAPEGSMDIRYKMSGVTLNYMPGTRPLTRLSAEGRTIGPLTEISIGRGTADLGNGRSLAVVSGKFSTRDMSPRPAPTAVQLRLAGRLADMGAALAQPGLAAYAPDGLDIETMSGKIDAGLDIGFLLTRAKGDARVKASMKAKVSALRIDNFIGKTPLEQGNLDVSIREGLIAANGTGRMFGAPAQISMQKRGSGAMQGSVAFVLDEAARSKLGWKSGDTLKGPVGVKIAGPLGQTDTLRGDISLDLTKAAISGSVPGFDKPAGRPASASFAVSSKGKGATLNNFVFRGGGLAARGVIELGADNSFTQARLSQLKISPGDDLRADIRAEGGGLRIALSGAAIDLRPALGSDGPSPFGGKASTPVTVSVETRLATGFNGRVLSNFKLQLAADGGGVSKFDLNASAGRSAIRGRLLQKSAAGPYIELSGADAGTVLSFLDVYKRMDGGRMVLRARVARDGGVAGTLDVRNFVLRNEPALRKLVAQGAPQGPESGRRFDATLVRFDKLQFGFSRGNGRLAVSDGIISGPEIGLTLDGAIDFSGDRVSMNGTFVPAYALNNVFARIPLFGPLLGGGKNEGLLGVNFRVSGRASAPLLNINPLSAIAPGFLRKIFGVVPLQAQPQARQVPQRLPNMPLSLGPQR